MDTSTSHLDFTSNNLTTDAKAVPPRTEREHEQLINNEKKNVFRPTSVPRTDHHNGNKKAGQNTVITIINGNGIHIGDRVVYNVGSASSTEKIPKTDDICKLLKSKQSVTKEHLFFLKSNIGENWKQIARNLGYKESQIYQFNEDHRSYGISEVIYQLLLDWMQNNPETATIGLLSTTLWENNEREAVSLLAQRP